MRRLAASALAVLVFAGCGAEEAAREVVDPVAEAAERTAEAGGARVDGAMLLTFGDRELEFTIGGAVDFQNERSRLRVKLPAFSAAEQREFGFPHEVIRDGLLIYVTNPTLRDGMDERWAKADFEEMADQADLDAEALGQWDESDPQDLLRFLEAAGGAKPTGRERIGGTRTTRYTATVSVERFAEIVAPDADAEFRRGMAAGMREQLGSDTIETRVWLDEDGLIRREEFDMGMVFEGERVEGVMRLDLKDFGDGHEIDLPDDGDVKDVTGEWEKYKVHFTG